MDMQAYTGWNVHDKMANESAENSDQQLLTWKEKQIKDKCHLNKSRSCMQTIHMLK
jgi:hypothetical protein